MNSNRQQLTTMVLALTGVGIAFWLLNTMTWLYADDYSYAFFFCAEGGIDLREPISLSNLLESQYNHYFVKNGRTVVHLLDQFFLCFRNKHVFNLCNALVFVGYIYMLQVIVKRKSWTCTLTIMALLFLLSRSFGQVYLWQSGSLNYLWAGLGNLLFLAAFLRQRRSGNTFAGIVLLLPSLLVGWMQETISIGMAAMTIGILVSDWREKRQLRPAPVLMTAGYMVGTLLIVCSPGTLQRAAASGTNLSYMLTHVPFGIANILLNLRIFWLLAITVAVLAVSHRLSIREFLSDNKYPLLALAAEALFLIPLGRVVEPRALFGIELFSLLMLLRLLPVSSARLGIASAIACVAIYIPVFHLTWENNQMTRAFHQEMMNADEAVFFDVPYYHGMQRHYVGSRIDLDHHRTAFNKEFATYYGKSGILVLPRRYRQELYLTAAFINPSHQCAPGEYTDDDIAFTVVPLPADQALPPSTVDKEYVSFPSGKYLLKDDLPMVHDGNAQVRPKAKKRRR